MDVATVVRLGKCTSVTTWGKHPDTQAMVVAELGAVHEVYADYVIDNRTDGGPDEVWELHGYDRRYRVVIGTVEIHYPGDPL